MQDNQFDDILRKKLSEAVPKGGHSDWSQFAEKLKQSQPYTFDEAVTHKLRNIPTAKVSEHWLILKQRLEAIKEVREFVLRTKFLEILLYIVSIYTFINVYPFYKIEPKQPIPVAEYQHSATANTKDISVVVASNVLNETEEALTVSTQEPVIKKKQVTHNIPLLSRPQMIAKQLSRLITLDKQQSLPKLNQQLVLTPISEVSDLDGVTDLAISSTEQATTHSLQKPMQPNARHWHIHGVFGLNSYMISTPYDHLFKLDGYRQDANGSDVSVLVSYESARGGVESGISYGKMAYSPVGLVESTQSGNLSLDLVETSLLSLPLNVKLYTNQTNDWSYYAMISVTGHFHTHNSYTITQNGEPLPVQGVIPKSKLNDKTFDKGLFNGGQFGLNTYATAGVGLGVQRRFSSDIALYGQATYKTFITNSHLGPNADTWQNLKLSLGLKLCPFYSK